MKLPKIPKPAEIRKALTAASATLVVAVGAGLVTHSLGTTIAGLIASALAGIATYSAPPNDPPKA